MKIYSFSDTSYRELNLQKEWVYVERDFTLEHYQTHKDDSDIDVVPYLCKVNWGEYMRVAFKRKFFLGCKEVGSLEELEKWLDECYKEQIWFEIGSKDGIMQFDPWGE